jgi:hypothetical protein
MPNIVPCVDVHGKTINIIFFVPHNVLWVSMLSKRFFYEYCSGCLELTVKHHKFPHKNVIRALLRAGARTPHVEFLQREKGDPGSIYGFRTSNSVYSGTYLWIEFKRGFTPERQKSQNLISKEIH